VRWNNIDRSPAADLRLEREPAHRERFLTADEAGELLAVCTPWLRLVVLAALHTGGRRGELLALEWEDVDLDRRRATFRETKNGEPRTIALTETLVAALKQVRPKFNAAGRVFLNHGGEQIHPDGLTWSFRLAARKAGLVGFRFHDLRHSAASFMVQAGVPLNTVRDVLGHKSLTMTLRYAHLAPAHQADAVRALDAVGACR
jgi:integrase